MLEFVCFLRCPRKPAERRRKEGGSGNRRTDRCKAEWQAKTADQTGWLSQPGSTISPQKGRAGPDAKEGQRSGSEVIPTPAKAVLLKLSFAGLHGVSPDVLGKCFLEKRNVVGTHRRRRSGV